MFPLTSSPSRRVASAADMMSGRITWNLVWRGEPDALFKHPAVLGQPSILLCILRTCAKVTGLPRALKPPRILQSSRPMSGRVRAFRNPADRCVGSPRPRPTHRLQSAWLASADGDGSVGRRNSNKINRFRLLFDSNFDPFILDELQPML
jgi:hypothetical protein